MSDVLSVAGNSRNYTKVPGERQIYGVLPRGELSIPKVLETSNAVVWIWTGNSFQMVARSPYWKKPHLLRLWLPGWWNPYINALNVMSKILSNMDVPDHVLGGPGAIHHLHTAWIFQILGIDRHKLLTASCANCLRY